jgi:bifunctional non-homologous end joining protein LigD
MSRKRFGPYTVELSREDKVLFPDEGITKGDVIQYYQEVAEPLVRHLKGRPVTLQRFPDGISEEGFYQKATPDYFPDWIPRAHIPLEGGGSQEQVLVSNAAGLAYLANQGVLTLHGWLSHRDHLRTPDEMVFDLDPPGESFGPVRKAARHLRDLLRTLGLHPFLMTTGSTGAHVRVPLRRGPDFEPVREFARGVARHLAQAHPDTLTTQVRKNKRGGRLFLDVGRNAYGQTAVAPYSLRPRRRASVATPLDWDELENPRLAGDSFTIQSIPRRLDQRSDPWKGMGRHGRSLDGPGETLEKMKKG